MISLKSIQTEIDASYLYKILAENEEDKAVAEVFKQMSEIEHSHAVAFIQKTNLTETDLPLPFFRAKTLHKIGKVFGFDYVLGVLLDTEKSISNSVIGARKKSNATTGIPSKTNTTEETDED